jgi:hypothetical protein
VGAEKISHFAGHGAFFGMRLADIAPHHSVSRSVAESRHAE